MANFNIGQQNAASIQNIGGDAVIEGGIHAYATWEVVELRRVIARAQERCRSAGAASPDPGGGEPGSSTRRPGKLRSRSPTSTMWQSTSAMPHERCRRRALSSGRGPRSSNRSAGQPGSSVPWAQPSSAPSRRPIDSPRGRSAPHRELSLWRGSLRSERASDLGELLPLHALPETNRHRRLGTGSNRPRIASNHGRGGARPRLRARGWIPEGVLLRLRFGALEHSPGHEGRLGRPHERLRPGPRRQAELPAVRGVRGRVGADPGRRASAPPGRASAADELTWAA